MIKDKEAKRKILDDYRGSSSLSNMSFDELENRIREIAGINDIPIEVKQDVFRVGNALVNNMGNCLVLSHPDHGEDYYGILVLMKSEGHAPIINAYYLGNSAQISIAAKQAIAKENRSERLSKMGLVSAVLLNAGSAAMSGIRSLQSDGSALEEEKQYYSLCVQVLKAAVTD